VPHRRGKFLKLFFSLYSLAGFNLPIQITPFSAGGVFFRKSFLFIFSVWLGQNPEPHPPSNSTKTQDD
jgi:hypothetical protein